MIVSKQTIYPRTTPRCVPALTALGAVAIVAACTSCQQSPGKPDNTSPVASSSPPPAPAPAFPAPTTLLVSMQDAVKQAPRDPKPRWQLVNYYRQMGDLPAAAAQLQELQRLEPQNPAPSAALASQYLTAQQWPEAEAAYRKLTLGWPKKVEGWEGLAGTLFHEKRYLEASEAARKAVALDPKNPAYHAILGTSLMELALQFPNRSAYKAQLAEARKELASILPNWSQKGEVAYRLGRVCLTQRDYGGAITYFTQAQDLLPDRSAIPFSLASAYIGKGDRVSGRKIVEEALQRFPQEAALHDLLGQLIQRSKDPDAAVRSMQCYTEAVRLAPEVERFVERYGGACLRLNRLQEARAAFEKSVRLNPNRAYPYQQLALVYNRLNDPNRARAAAKIAAEVVRDDQQLKQVQNLSAIRPNDVPLHLILADRYRDLGMREPARDQYLMVLQIEPANARAKQGISALERKTP